MAEASVDVLNRYLRDAIAAEESYEAQFERFVSQDEFPEIKSVYRRYASEIRNHRERLAVRLEGLGGSVATGKGLLAHFLRLTPKTLQHGRVKEGARLENAVLAFAIENSEVALYEVLANVAEAAGDSETVALTRSIQQEIRTSAAQTWEILPATALRTLSKSLP
jgi:ferritin-like metal-binding protein YciE